MKRRHKKRYDAKRLRLEPLLKLILAICIHTSERIEREIMIAFTAISNGAIANIAVRLSKIPIVHNNSMNLILKFELYVTKWENLLY